MRVERVREYQTEGATRTAQQRAPRMQQVAVAEGEQALVHQAAHRPRLLRRVTGQRQHRRLRQEQRHHRRLKPREDTLGQLTRAAHATAAAATTAAAIAELGAVGCDTHDGATASDGGGVCVRLGQQPAPGCT